MTTPFILAIDPGSTHSAYVGLNRLHGTVLVHGRIPNADLLAALRDRTLVRELGGLTGTAIAIEEVRSFMARVGREVFDTVRWAGRFEEAAVPSPVVLLGRKEVVVSLTGTARGNDADVRAALIDRYGGPGGKEAAVGRKASPGPLYGIAADEWSALGIAVTWCDTKGATS